jgi:hypothetical protein
MSNKFFKRADVIIIAIIFLFSGLVYQFAFAESVPKAEIYYYSDLVETVELDKGREMTFSLPQEEDVIFQLDSDGGIGFIQSDCPDKVCVRAGKLHRVGQFAACVPNGLMLKIVSDDSGDDGADIIIGY